MGRHLRCRPICIEKISFCGIIINDTQKLMGRYIVSTSNLVKNYFGEISTLAFPVAGSQGLLFELRNHGLVPTLESGWKQGRVSCPIDKDAFIKLYPFIKVGATFADIVWIYSAISDKNKKANREAMKNALMVLLIARAKTSQEKAEIERLVEVSKPASKWVEQHSIMGSSLMLF